MFSACAFTSSYEARSKAQDIAFSSSARKSGRMSASKVTSVGSLLPAGAVVDGDRVSRRHEAVQLEAAEAAAVEEEGLAASVRDRHDLAEHERVVSGRFGPLDVAA